MGQTLGKIHVPDTETLALGIAEHDVPNTDLQRLEAVPCSISHWTWIPSVCPRPFCTWIPLILFPSSRVFVEYVYIYGLFTSQVSWEASLVSKPFTVERDKPATELKNTFMSREESSFCFMTILFWPFERVFLAFMNPDRIKQSLLPYFLLTPVSKGFLFS